VTDTQPEARKIRDDFARQRVSSGSAPEPRAKATNGCHLRALELGDRDGPVEGDDRRAVEPDELVVEGDDLRQSVSGMSRVEVCTASIAARIW
jgi:hypothetical protein